MNIPLPQNCVLVRLTWLNSVPQRQLTPRSLGIGVRHEVQPLPMLRNVRKSNIEECLSRFSIKRRRTRIEHRKRKSGNLRPLQYGFKMSHLSSRLPQRLADHSGKTQPVFSPLWYALSGMHSATCCMLSPAVAMPCKVERAGTPSGNDETFSHFIPWTL